MAGLSGKLRAMKFMKRKETEREKSESERGADTADSNAAVHVVYQDKVSPYAAGVGGPGPVRLKFGSKANSKRHPSDETATDSRRKEKLSGGVEKKKGTAKRKQPTEPPGKKGRFQRAFVKP